MTNGGVNGPGYNAGYAYFQQLQQMDPTAIHELEVEDPQLEQEIRSGHYTPQQVNDLLMKLGTQSGKNLQNLPPQAKEAAKLYGERQPISVDDMNAFLSAVFGAPA
jgi:hypothetical protein